MAEEFTVNKILIFFDNYCQFGIQHSFFILKLSILCTFYWHTPLIIPTVCTLLISTNIKWASTCFGTRAPSSERMQC